MQNFKEIYEYLRKNNISISVKKNKELADQLHSLFKKKINPKKIQNKIKTIGDQILKKTYNEIFVKTLNEL